MGDNNPFIGDEDSGSDEPDSEPGVEEIDSGGLPDQITDALGGSQDLVTKALGEIISANALVFGLAIGVVIGLSGDVQLFGGIVAAILAGERVKLRLSEKVKVNVIKEPSLAIIGSIIGYLMSVHIF